jgi:hypothetical protein
MNFRVSGMSRFFLATVILLAPIGLCRQALASGDFGCSTTWRLVHHDYDGCSNMVLLSPANDTRVNLLLLIADLRLAKSGAALKAGATSAAPLFSWDELAFALGPQANKAAPGVGTAAAPSEPVPCPPTVPTDDPFTVALQADHGLQPQELDALLAARRKTQSGCAADAAASAIAGAEKVTKTPSAKAYALYLEGAAAFWRADYDKAAATFVSLANTQTPWARETATYMIGRALINSAQEGAFDEYGSFKKDWHADAKTVTAAEAALDKYLQQYPKGAYAQSARGLKRRGYWLAQDTARLEGEYAALLLLSPQERGMSDADLVQEIDNKIATPPDASDGGHDSVSENALMKATHDPLLLAMLDLLAMRTPEITGSNAGGHHSDPLAISELQRQKPYFAAQMPLYEYLLAVHAFYIENKPAEVLHMLPDAARQSSFSYVQFSRQVLRGMALEAVKDHNALSFWMQMLPGAKAASERPVLELAIALHEERAGEVRNVFASASPVHYPYLREVLLTNIADANLLRTESTNTGVSQRERDLALFTLLYKETAHGDAVNFLKDLALVPAKAPTKGEYMLDNSSVAYVAPGDTLQLSAIPLGIFLHDKTDTNIGCPGLRVSEQQLAQDADNPTAWLCVADFMRLNQSSFALGEAAPSADELGGTPPLYPGGPFVRMDTYTAVLANPKSSRNDKAYALYRAVNCYGPSGNNACGGKDVPQAQRKAWFTTLKRDYAGTRWANAQQIYW